MKKDTGQMQSDHSADITEDCRTLYELVGEVLHAGHRQLEIDHAQAELLRRRELNQQAISADLHRRRHQANLRGRRL